MMASPFTKRLERLEALLASKINAPLTTLWIDQGQSKAEACIRSGYDPSQLDRIRFVRWLDPALGEAAPPPAPAEHGPPEEAPDRPDPQQIDLEELIAAAPIEPDPEAETRYREAIERREKEIVAEKLQAATTAFAKSIA
jgi:hypothetical protein